MPTKLQETSEKLAATRTAIKTLLDSKPDRDFSDDELGELRRLNTQANAEADEVKKWQAVEEIASANQAGLAALNQPRAGLPMPGLGSKGLPDPDRMVKTLEQRIQESAGFRALRASGKQAAIGLPLLELSPAEFKTIVTLGDIAPQAQRLGLVESAQEERTVADLMLPGMMNSNTLEYYEETTFTNAAATVAEGGTKPESALDYTLRTETARKIATWIPATDELLSDVAQMEANIRGRLAFMVRRVEETQLLSGSGVAPQITGILNRSGIQTQAKGADPVPDAIFKGMVKVRNTGFAEPTGIVMHPNDHQDLVLLRSADGVYLFGPLSQNLPDRLWGLDIRVTTAMTENTALVGAFRPYAQVFRRTGITVQMSTEHSTYFVENKVAILAEERLALAVYRPSAFCTVTGI